MLFKGLEPDLNMKTVQAVFIMSVLLVWYTVGLHIVKADSAEPATFSSGLTVYSPLNTVYSSYSVLCNASLRVSMVYQSSISYSIDGKDQGSSGFKLQFGSAGYYYVAGSFMLPPLHNGPHQLTFAVEIALYNYSGPPPSADFKAGTTSYGVKYYAADYVNTLSFTIYSNEAFPTPAPTPTMPPPAISNVSIKNTTYNTGDIPLNFTTDEPVNWTGYSLDGKDNVTINGNTTLTRLSNGSHNVTIYANDTFGNTGSSQTISFTVAVPEPYPAATVAVVSGILAVVAVGVGLSIYFRRRKSNVSLN
jgi:hypothetical protein